MLYRTDFNVGVNHISQHSIVVKNDDYVVNVEISVNGNEMFINSFEIEDLL